MKKLGLGLLAVSLLTLAGCQAGEGGSVERTLLVEVNDKTLTNDEFDAVTDFTGANILFAEISFDFFYRGLDDVKLYLMENESVTQEEADSLWKEAEQEQEEYYRSKNQGMADLYSLSSYCDVLEVSEYLPSVELVYLDGKISEAELNQLNLVLKDEHTESVAFYTD